MYATTASTSGAASDGIGAATATSKPRRTSRSHSFSSASIVTVKRPGSRSSTSTGPRNSIAPTRSHSPVESRIPTRLSREAKPSDHHQRRKSSAVDVFDPAGIEGVSGVDRWSQSTTSSVTSAGNHSRRNRSSSGAVLSSVAGQQFLPRHQTRPSVESVTRSSPQKKAPSRTNSLRQAASAATSPQHSRRPSRADALLADEPSDIPPLNTAPALTDPNDNESPSTVQTIATPTTQSSAYAQSEYFGRESGDASPRNTSKAQYRPLVMRSPVPSSVPPTAAVGPQAQSDDLRRQPSNAEPDRHAQGSHRRSRTQEKADKEKKSMLSKALEKANTAVLLDNAQNYEGALGAYSDACALLMQVMERTSSQKERKKLSEISETYSHRIQELNQLVQSQPLVTEEKNLPLRPMSDGSASPTSPMPVPISTSPVRSNAPQLPSLEERQAGTRRSFAPRLSYHHQGDRDSFFSKTMAAVQGSMLMDHDDFARDESPFTHATIGAAVEEEPPSLGQTPVHLPPPEHAHYMPRPLSPRRPPSPQLQAQVEEAWLADPDQLPGDLPHHQSPPRGNSHESITWLDTIDESASSRSSSVHSVSSQDGLRRKHIRGASGDTDAEFDAAFDAAVEAAYNEGYEPDVEGRDQQTPAAASFQHRPKLSVAGSASDVREITHPQAFKPSGDPTTELSDEEEERLLDEMTQDFASGLGFSFDVQTKSALPRQSDSSGYSRSTWQSSQTSDRATAATSLSTVAENGLTAHMTATTTATPATASTTGTPTSTATFRPDPPSLPLPTAPAQSSLPRPPSTSSVRNRRFSGQNPKQLKIETTAKGDSRKRASTFHHSGSPFAEEDEGHALPLLPTERESKTQLQSVPTSSDALSELTLQPLPTLELHSIPDDKTRPVTASAATEHRGLSSYEDFPSELQSGRPTLFRKNKSSASLREHTAHTLLLASPDLDSGPSLITPMSSTFATFVAKRNQNPLTSQRANLPPMGAVALDGPNSNGVYLFDTSLTTKPGPTSPRVPALSQPSPIEPCPESLLLRPFWLMRTLATTLTHPRGGFLTTKLFIPREVWETRGVKLKLLEDKIANCDLLTAALGRLANVDSYDVDAIMDELQSFEEVVERVQAALGKRLGHDVGVHGAASFFKDAAVTSPGHADPISAALPASAAGAGVDKAAKSNSGKSYLSSWRKLRNKSSGAPLTGSSSHGSGGSTTASLSRQHSATNIGDKDHQQLAAHTMPSVPMTSFVPVERRGQSRRGGGGGGGAESTSSGGGGAGGGGGGGGSGSGGSAFTGPQREYLGSLTRLFDGAQVLDRIARQVEDPGLRHSSPTHVGLELSTRHAAEFFAFYVCRFVLADLGLLLEKFLKKGTEWVLA